MKTAFMLKYEDGGTEKLVCIFTKESDAEDAIAKINMMPCVPVQEGTRVSYLRFLKVGETRVFDQKARWFIEPIALHEDEVTPVKMTSAKFYAEEDAGNPSYF